MTRSQGKPLSEDEIKRIRMLLTDKDLSMAMIAERMNCTRSPLSRINKDLEIRAYKGQRSNWAVAG